MGCDQLPQLTDRDHEYRARLAHHRGGIEPLTGEQIQLGYEVTGVAHPEFPFRGAVPVKGRDRPCQDDEEVVAAVTFAEEQLTARRRVFGRVRPQQIYLRGRQAGSKRAWLGSAAVPGRDHAPIMARTWPVAVSQELVRFPQRPASSWPAPGVMAA